MIRAMKNNRRKQLLQLAFIIASISLFGRYTLLEKGRRTLTETRLLRKNLEGVMLPYNQTDIESFYYNIRIANPMLLVFDGQTFKAYTLGLKLSYRYVLIIPFMVHALETNHPERFQRGQPVFQMIFSISDGMYTKCVNKLTVNKLNACPIQKFFPPIVSFSTVNRDETVLPTAKSFPNPVFMGCMYDWKLKGKAGCPSPIIDESIPWDDLKNTIVWRGSDHRFFLEMYEKYSSMNTWWLEKVFTTHALATMSKMSAVTKLLYNYDDLSPRWKAVAMTLKTNVQDPKLLQTHWIDAMFTGEYSNELHTRFSERGIAVSADKAMDAQAMSRYKYQIDLGGGGGTTWEGTLTKLRMPGVLFHHETPTKDWFYDLMKPWVHYIPVRTDLADLLSRYHWAEAHPEEVKKIAAESTKLAKYLMSYQYLDKVYQELFVDFFGKVVEAYEPNGMSWEECLEGYKKQGIPVQSVSVCNHKTCSTEAETGVIVETIHLKTPLKTGTTTNKFQKI